MAQQYTDPNFGTLIIPSSVAGFTVQAGQGGLSTTGVVMLLGEADAGPDFTLEPDITLNGFGPTQQALVQAKYKSGPVVDAFINACQASNDPNIVGSPSSIVICKTNSSAKATSQLLKNSGGNYALLADRSWGKLGNQIFYNIASNVAETVPTVTFTWITNVAGVNSFVFSNGGNPNSGTSGGASVTANIAAASDPATFVTTLGTALFGTPSANEMLVTGGTNRLIATGITGASATAVLSLAVNVGGNPNAVTFTLSGSSSPVWNTIPSIGDTLEVSVANTNFAGASQQNVGAYIVTGATSTTISAIKLSDGGKVTPSPVAGVITQPVTFSGQQFTATPNNDIKDFAPVTVAMNVDSSTVFPIDGFGKSFEFGDLGTGDSQIFYTFTGPSAPNTSVAASSNGQSLPQSVINVGSTSGFASSGKILIMITGASASVQTITYTGITATSFTGCTGGTGSLATGNQIYQPSTWVSLSGAPQLVKSAAEQSVTFNDNRQVDNITESFTVGGEIPLLIGYSGTTATLTISTTNTVNASGQVIQNGTLTTSVTGGSGANLNINLANFSTINALATFINTQTGYNCSVGLASLGQLSPFSLDSVSAVGICTKWGTSPGRIKDDGFRFGQALNNGSILVETFATTLPSTSPQVLVPTPPASGLPAVNANNVFLTGGTRGGTTNTIVSSALVALQRVRGNYLVPLFSRDATLDIADNITDSTSTYTITSINAACLSHVLAMSVVKRKRNRQAFLSIRDTFVNAQQAAGNIASFRASMNFQDIRSLGSDGSIHQFQPWMGASLAAGMQAAAFYRAIVHKQINCNGVLQAAGDFNDSDNSAMETALLAGLLPARRSPTGGFIWVSDQTTYGRDNNFVFNSIQAVSSADIIALTTAQRMEDAFVGQVISDVSASVALAFLESIMDDFLRLRLISPSDDAPLGYKNAVINISGPVMRVSLEIKLATAIYFIPISFLVSQVTQTATSSVGT